VRNRDVSSCRILRSAVLEKRAIELDDVTFVSLSVS
jgi:hypothetical protein